MKKLVAMLALVALLGAMGCAFTSKATEFNGLPDCHGKKITHVNTTKVALHLLFKDPLVGDATIQSTVAEWSAQCKAAGASQVRIVQSHKKTYWWLLFPITLVINPVVTNVAGDAVPGGS
jgi:hypothetical protein